MEYERNLPIQKYRNGKVGSILNVTFGVVNAFARTEYKILVVGYRFFQSKMKYLQSC